MFCSNRAISKGIYSECMLFINHFEIEIVYIWESLQYWILYAWNHRFSHHIFQFLSNTSYLLPPLIYPACFKIEGLVFPKLISAVSNIFLLTPVYSFIAEAGKVGRMGKGFWLVCYLVPYQTGCSVSYRKRNRPHGMCWNTRDVCSGRQSDHDSARSTYCVYILTHVSSKHHKLRKKKLNLGGI